MQAVPKAELACPRLCVSDRAEAYEALMEGSTERTSKQQPHLACARSSPLSLVALRSALVIDHPREVSVWQTIGGYPCHSATFARNRPFCEAQVTLEELKMSRKWPNAGLRDGRGARRQQCRAAHRFGQKLMRAAQ